MSFTALLYYSFRVSHKRFSSIIVILTTQNVFSFIIQVLLQEINCSLSQSIPLKKIHVHQQTVILK